MKNDATTRIGEWLKHFGPAPTATICEALDLAQGKARATLKRMVASGLVNRVPGGRAAVWRLSRKSDMHR